MMRCAKNHGMRSRQVWLKSDDGAKSRYLILICNLQVYGVIGIFGAARYGTKTEGNVLVNEWLGGPAEGFLDLAIAAYLSISVPPMQVPPPHPSPASTHHLF